MVSAMSRFDRPTGICRSAANLASSLAQAPEISRVSLVVGSWQKDYFRDLLRAVERVEIIAVRITNSSISRNIWFMQGLPRLAAKAECQVLHCSFPIPVRRSTFAGLLVTTVHDLYAFDCPENFGFPAVWFNQLFFNMAVSRSEGIVCDSQETSNRLNFHFPKLAQSKKTAVIPISVNFSGANPRRPALLGSSDNSSFVLCVAQHRRNKNLDLLVQAFAELKRLSGVSPDLLLLIVGSPGPETANIQAMAKALCGGSVRFASGLPDNELAWLYQHCEVLVISSSQEGFCLPLVEGMYFGSKIVCSDIPTLREFGSKDCVYVDLGGAPLTLTGAMRRALTGCRAVHSDAGIRFRPEVVSGLHVQFYKDLQEKAWKTGRMR
jgi:glycosyltransferase involved in cell wall biosynthesis